MSWFKTDYVEEFHKAVQSGNQDLQTQILKKAYEKEGITSEVVSKLALLIASAGLPYFSFLELFLRENPYKIHPAQVSLAAHYANQGQFDQATFEARSFLAKVHTAQLIQGLQEKPNLRHNVGRAYLLLTAAYTELGARSYSCRVLERGLALAISDEMRGHLEREIETLRKELAEPAHLQLDAKWEAFFTSGAHASELLDLCEQKKLPILAKRVDLLEGHFRFNSGLKIDEGEMLKEVHHFNDPSSGKTVHLLR